MAYYCEPFTTPGYFNGFPFLLAEREDWLKTSGINQTLETTVSHYWNLAKLTAKFKIHTDQKPASYATGFAYKEGASPNSDQEVVVEYEVVDSVDEALYEPYMRMAPEITGVSEAQSLSSSSNLIQESGNSYTSCYVTDEPNFTIPITIQPSNTGAFVITSESDVADHFAGLSQFGSKSDFEVELKMDWGSGLYPPDVDRQASTQTWYIVPAKDWGFTVSTGELVGSYYTYPNDPVNA